MLTISKQMVVRQVIKKLRLRFYGWGVVIEEGGYRGWSEIDIPRVDVEGVRMREKYYGEVCCSKREAMESASDSAIKDLVRGGNVIIKDLNYDKVVMLEERLDRADGFGGMLLDVVDLKEKQIERMYMGYTELFVEVRRMCRQFSDLLPIRFADVDDAFGRPDVASVVYGGVRPPASSLEKLTFALVGLIDRGT